MKLLIVLVNYNGFQLTADCLDAIAPIRDEVSDSCGRPGIRVGLCDNGSKPGEAKRLADFIADRGYADWCALTAIAPNLGFCGGNNAVIRPALASENPPDYVLLLNNDTLPYPGAFRELVAFMDDPRNARVGCAGSRLEDLPPSHPTPTDWLQSRGAQAAAASANPQVSAFRFFSLRSEFQSASHLGPIYRLLRNQAVGMPIPPGNAKADWVAGASLIIRRDVLEQIGPLDDAYYTYFDDIDYCHSAKKAGYETWYVPASRVVHLVGQTTGVTHAQTDAAAKAKKKAKPRAAYWFQARHRYWLKHHGKPIAALADLALIAGTALCRLTQPLTGKDHGLPARFLRDALKTSVLFTGFKPPHVVNPETGTPNPTTPNVIDPQTPRE
ncbi:MAG: glycosyltransferase family 2 protein [Planctomycetota bacterium]